MMACGSDALFMLALDGDTTSTVSVRERGSSVSLAAATVTGEAHTFPIDDDTTRLSVIEYAAGLRALELDEGELRAVAEGPNVRGLPASALRVSRLDLESGVPTGEWVSRSTLDELERIKLAGRSWVDCVRDGGCARGSECALPCEPPATPSPPEAPTEPDAVVVGEHFDCPLGAPASCELRRPPECPTSLALAESCAAEAPCAAGEWPDSSGSEIFVKSQGPSGDGSRTRPFGSLSAALAAAPDGGTILLSRGPHRGFVFLTRPVRIRGVCARETRIDAAGAPSVLGIGADVEVEGVTLFGSAAAVVQSAGSARLHDVRVEAGTDGVVAAGGELELSFVSIVAGAAAVRVQGASVSGATVNLEGPTSIGVESGSLALSEFVARGLVQSHGHARLAMGTIEGELWATGSEATRASVELDSVRIFGWLIASRSEVDLADVQVTGSPYQGLRVMGSTLAVRGLYVGSVRAEGVLLEGSVGSLSGLLVSGAHISALAAMSSTVTATDLTVAGVDPVDPWPSAGVAAWAGSDVALQRARISRVQEAVRAYGPRSEVRVDDLSADEFLPGPHDQPSTGLLAFAGAVLVGARASIAGAGRGVGAFDPSTRLELTDFSITDTLDGTTGHGVTAYDDVHVALTRGVIDSARCFGVYGKSSVVVLIDVEILRTQPCDDGRFGMGIRIDEAGSSRLFHVAVRGAHDAAISTFGENATLTGEDVVLEGTHGRVCRECDSVPTGSGALVLGASRLELERFLAARNAQSGLALLNGSEVDLSSGLVADQPIGINVLIPGYDLATLLQGVSFENNERSLLTVD